MKCLHQNKTSLRVRYGETDQMGYCYYGNYAQFFEVGRVEALRELGMSYRDMENNGVMLPVKNYSVDYLYPAKYDDLLTIITDVEKLEGTRLYFTYKILNEQHKCIAKAQTVLVFVDKTSMKPIAPPLKFMQILKNGTPNEK